MNCWGSCVCVSAAPVPMKEARDQQGTADDADGARAGDVLVETRVQVRGID